MKRIVLLLITTLTLALSATGAMAQTNDNIVDIAAKNNNFDTLHAAIVAAGLADTLASADSEFTVFAPTDAAFQNVEAAAPGTLEAVLADPDGLLTTILTYHVVAGTVTSSDLADGDTLTTLQGEDLSVSIRNGNVFINDARVLTADVAAKNGVIHVINGVLLPEAITGASETATESPAATTPVATTPSEETAGETSMMTIAEIAVANGNFTQLVGALQAAGLVETFAMPGNYTVFAPTDAAFEALGDVDLSMDELEAILLYHVVNDRLTRDQLATDDLVPTLSDGRPLIINRDGRNIIDISGAKVLMYDIEAANGIIHVIDRVLIP